MVCLETPACSSAAGSPLACGEKEPTLRAMPAPCSLLCQLRAEHACPASSQQVVALAKTEGCRAVVPPPQ